MGKKHLKALIRYFQADSEDLKVDGLYGPKTEEALNLYILNSVHLPEAAMDRVWESALKDVGQGGSGGNNRGRYIENLRTACGWDPKVVGPWCAVFQTAHLSLSGIPIRSRGAYRLVENMVNHKQGFEVEPDDMEVGRVYLACWKRGRWDTHNEAHVRLVRLVDSGPVDGVVDYIGGNEAGDKVKHGALGANGFRHGLIMIAGWNG